VKPVFTYSVDEELPSQGSGGVSSGLARYRERHTTPFPKAKGGRCARSAS
jgi:hypothetical protein